MSESLSTVETRATKKELSVADLIELAIAVDGSTLERNELAALDRAFDERVVPEIPSSEEAFRRAVFAWLLGRTEEAVTAMLRKLVKSNQDTLAAGPTEERRAILEREVLILEELLPQTLSMEEIQAALEPVREAVLGAAGDGQATGVAMKHLKSEGASVTGKDVCSQPKIIIILTITRRNNPPNHCFIRNINVSPFIIL